MNKIISSVSCIVVLSINGLAQVALTETTPKWYKGNTHTHTINSDGDSPPDAVVKWYRDNRYNFLFITDHEFVTPAAPLNREFGKPGEFMVIQGQEVTDSLNKKPHHINALGVNAVTMPGRGQTTRENLQRNIDAIRSIGGVPQINHPNFGWALTADDIWQTKNVMLMEIYNGHPLVNNLGGGGSPGTEEIWDALLTRGKLIYGIADDDSHFFKRLGDRSAPTPGHGWVVVRAGSLTPQDILSSLERGDFYASTGVELADYQANHRSVTIKVLRQKGSKYTVRFIGRRGRVLSTTFLNPGVYKIRGNEGYVRAKVVDSNGKSAWTQPIMLARK